MKTILTALFLSAFSISAFAETKTFTVKGMHCDGCVETVREKLCKNEAYKTCTVKIKNAKKELGEVTVETKTGPVDMKSIKTLLEAEGYKL